MTGRPPAVGPAAVGQLSDLTLRQNEPPHLERLRAYSYRYKVAQRWRIARLAGTLAFAGVAPFLSLGAGRDEADLIAAVSAGWLVIGRTLLQRLERAHYSRAVAMHELYDVKLFGLDWNEPLCGNRPLTVDMTTDAGHLPLNERRERHYTTWFTIDLTGVPYPTDVLLCQRQALSWSRKDRQAYAVFLLATETVWLLVGVFVAVLQDLLLAEYLVAIFLPCAPAFLDATELAFDHLQSARTGETVERRVERSVEETRHDPKLATLDLCRSFQDSVFLTRSSAARVPSWFYRVRRARSDRSTRAAAAAA
ncbi:S-4TM family putative pore-forming effector [Geodermatophilus sp. DSM 44513]|uniref:S-4TM family putative pore-forming effector n=1 Tax=Geodermatophilus sp. DSM 44513 TaxID=1528104 RepID=UPI00127AAB83|nr:S-4TM family putative pore-forming effector [Geodermatophilus sp. DSM 44513]WNV74348.1 S-4TM family putative pore-forming effector [Geodermatophilus sp. DSM 44513]